MLDPTESSHAFATVTAIGAVPLLFEVSVSLIICCLID
jgi:hypothetical protein